MKIFTYPFYHFYHLILFQRLHLDRQIITMYGNQRVSCTIVFCTNSFSFLAEFSQLSHSFRVILKGLAPDSRHLSSLVTMGSLTRCHRDPRCLRGLLEARAEREAGPRAQAREGAEPLRPPVPVSPNRWITIIFLLISVFCTVCFRASKECL